MNNWRLQFPGTGIFSTVLDMAEKKTTTRTANPRDEKIGQLIRDRRGTRSQSWLAEQMQDCGHRWSQSTVWAVENGYQAVKMIEAGDLADILDIEIADFVEHEDSDVRKLLRATRSLQAERESAEQAVRSWVARRAEVQAAFDALAPSLTKERNSLMVERVRDELLIEPGEIAELARSAGGDS